MTLAIDLTGLRDLSTAELLASGGDSRHVPGADGRNRYLNTYVPEKGLLTFGSCTSSTLSEEAYAAAERLHGWLGALEPHLLERAIDDLYERVRTEIIANISMPNAETLDVVVTPSGTDAEFVALLACLRERPLVNILVGAAEAGSGTVLAAGGRHFDTRTPSGREVVPGDPVDPAMEGRVETILVGVRDADGQPRDESNIDEEVQERVERAVAEGNDVLIHVIAHSKTGVHAPSLATVHRLVASHPERVNVVIDAAQGRFSRRGLRESLDRGYMTMTTGSKFFGGPPFAGAVLIPHHPWRIPLGVEAVPGGFDDYFTPAMMPQGSTRARASLSGAANIGLLLRWWAALAEIRDYYSVPAQLRLEVLRHAQSAFPARIATASHLQLEAIPPPLVENEAMRLLESKTTVFPFQCRDVDGRPMVAEQLAEVRIGMRDPLSVRHDLPAEVADLRVEIGQPVTLGGPDSPCVLRLALGAREIIRTCVTSAPGATFGERIESLDRDITLAVSKLDHLAGEIGSRPVDWAPR